MAENEELQPPAKQFKVKPNDAYFKSYFRIRDNYLFEAQRAYEVIWLCLKPERPSKNRREY